MLGSALLGLAFGSQLLITIAEGVPSFDPAPGCRAAIAVSPGSFEGCVKDERAARAQLTTQWEDFAASDRASCTSDERMGGTPSYVELLTCLQMAKAARAMPADKTDGSNR